MDNRYFGKDITNVIKVARQSTLDSRKRNQNITKVNISQKNDQKMIQKQVYKQCKKQNDPQYVNRYIFDIFKYIIAKQTHIPLVSFKSSSKVQITFEQRCKIVESMVQNHEKLRLFPQTLFMAIWILDKSFTQGFNCRKAYLQSIGVVILFIAAKYEETYRIPKLKDLSMKTGIVLNDNEIQEYQGKIIQIMNFNLTAQTSYLIFEALGKKTHLNTKYLNLGHYILQLSLLNQKMLDYNQSLIGCSAFYIASKLQNQQYSWPQQIQLLTSYKQQDLQDCVKSLIFFHDEVLSSPYKATRKKFSSTDYNQVAYMKICKNKVLMQKQ